MSAAKEAYCKYLADMIIIHKDGFRDEITDYVNELEQKISDLEKSQSQRQKILMYEHIQELKQQNKELIDKVKWLEEMRNVKPQKEK